MACVCIFDLLTCGGLWGNLTNAWCLFLGVGDAGAGLEIGGAVSQKLTPLQVGMIGLALLVVVRGFFFFMVSSDLNPPPANLGPARPNVPVASAPIGFGVDLVKTIMSGNGVPCVFTASQGFQYDVVSMGDPHSTEGTQLQGLTDDIVVPTAWQARHHRPADALICTVVLPGRAQSSRMIFVIAGGVVIEVWNDLDGN